VRIDFVTARVCVRASRGARPSLRAEG
jgi:hypothetical protein